MTKKTRQITTHTDDATADSIAELAALEGKSASEYADGVLKDHLQKKFSELSVLSKYAAAHNFVRSPGSEYITTSHLQLVK